MRPDFFVAVIVAVMVAFLTQEAFALSQRQATAIGLCVWLLLAAISAIVSADAAEHRRRRA